MKSDAQKELALIADQLAAALAEHDGQHPALAELDEWRSRHEPWIAEMQTDGCRKCLIDEL